MPASIPIRRARTSAPLLRQRHEPQRGDHAAERMRSSARAPRSRAPSESPCRRSAGSAEPAHRASAPPAGRVRAPACRGSHRGRHPRRRRSAAAGRCRFSGSDRGARPADQLPERELAMCERDADARVEEQRAAVELRSARGLRHRCDGRELLADRTLRRRDHDRELVAAQRSAQMRRRRPSRRRLPTSRSTRSPLR